MNDDKRKELKEEAAMEVDLNGFDGLARAHEIRALLNGKPIKPKKIDYKLLDKIMGEVK